MNAAYPSGAPIAGAAADRPACLIHIGYHRTGTSFLQEEFFPIIPGAKMAGRLEAAERHAADPALRLAVFSNEALSSDLRRDTPEVAANLARKFPGARVLIGIRSQYTVMRGVYHLYVKGGETDRYEAFVAARAGRLFDYAQTVDAYRAAFGHDNVFVLLHEDLSRDPLASMAAVLRFAGADPAVAAQVQNRRVKPSAGDPTMRLLRQRNRLIGPLRRLWPRAHREILYRGVPGSRLLDQTFGGSVRLPAGSVRPLIRDAYADGNARLFVTLQKNIADYDYPQPDR